MIKTENLIKTYNDGKVKALNGVSLEIKEGEFIVILGASGSGKTTLMNVMSGLEKPDSGKVFSCGENISDMNDKHLTEFRKKNVGFVFQQYYLLPQLSVESNVKLGADLSKNENYKDAIAAMGLSDKLKRRPFELSGGEQQRVCIARALAKRPKILFLDEPTGALDEETGREVLDYILKEKEKNNFTMIMVTHNANIAETAEKIIRMNSGKITEIVTNTDRKTAYEIGW